MTRNGECESPRVDSLDWNGEKSSEPKYIGGIVLQPKKGIYHDLIVVDVTSLYPTMAIIHNLSFDTVNCGCCEDNLQYRIDKDITKDCKIEKEYWVCKQNQGAFPKKLKLNPIGRAPESWSSFRDTEFPVTSVCGEYVMAE